MATVTRSRPLRKEQFAPIFKLQRPATLTDPSQKTTTRTNTSSTSIRHFSWSPTGTAIAATHSSNIKVWEPERSSPSSTSTARSRSAGATLSAKCQELKGHTGTVERVEWKPDREAELASTGGDGTVRIWDVRVGSGTAGNVSSSSASASVADVKIGDSGLFLTWRPNGTEIVVGRRDDVVVIIDVRMGAAGVTEELQVRPGSSKLQTTQTNQMCFSNGGDEMFATTGEGTVQILEWPSMKCLHTLNAHTSAASCVAHSPNGSYIAVGGGDSLISLWDTYDWICRRTLTGGTGAIHSVSFSFDGTYLVGGSGSDKDAQSGLDIAHVETGEVVHTIETTNAVSIAAWHPSRYWLAYAGDPGGIKCIGVGSSV